MNEADLKLRLEARDALAFLRDHPAFAFENGDSLFPGFWFMMAPCCKHGYTEDAGKHGITVYQGDPRFNEFSDLLVKQHDENELEDPDDILSVEVPYERMFGEPWSYDHMEYWYETTFFVFEGNPYSIESEHDFRKWGRYAGPQGGARSFEEMLIDAAKAVKEAFGDFNTYEHFHTPAEKLNQKSVEPIFWLPTDNPKYKQLEWNDKYVNVSNSLINLRWVEWFMTTEYAKKNWESSFKEWQNYIDNIKFFEEQKRRDNLAPYEV